MLGRPAAGPGPAAGRRLSSRNSQNSNYARRFSLGFSRSEWWVVLRSHAKCMRPVNPHTKYMRVYGGGDNTVVLLYMECSRVLDKSSKIIQYISVLYDCMIIYLGCSTFDLNENGKMGRAHNIII